MTDAILLIGIGFCIGTGITYLVCNSACRMWERLALDMMSENKEREDDDERA